MDGNFPIVNFGVRDEGGVPVVNSRDVARVFEKEHRNVLRDIDALVGCSDLSSLTHQGVSPFTLVTVWDEAANKMVRTFDMTRSGFVLLVMGWTGEKARRFKIAYIEAFDKMEEALRDLDNPLVLRRLLNNSNERVIKLQGANTTLQIENAELAPKAAALDQITVREGECSLREVGKELFPKNCDDIFPVLQAFEWIYRADSWLPYQTKVALGYLTMREVSCTDGRSRPQTMVTPKGRAKLATGLKSISAAAVDWKVNPIERYGLKVATILARAGYLKG